MESWLTTLRTGFLPQLSRAALEALARGLESDDPQLIQGATTSPPPLACVADWVCEGACLIGYAGWQGENLATVAEVEEFFARACFACDELMGEPASSRWLTNFWDETTRDVARTALLSEVRRALAQRAA